MFQRSKLKRERAHHIKNKKERNIRINLMIAFIFLFCFFIILKLYSLQIDNYGFYEALASNQHKVSDQIQAERGKIFIRNKKSSMNPFNHVDTKDLDTFHHDPSDLGFYAFATNKEFAFLYVVPSKVEDSHKISEVLYEIFEKEEIEKEVDELLEEQDENKKNEEINYVKAVFPREERSSKIEEILNRYETRKDDPEFQELFQFKKESEIDARKEIIIKDYLKKIEKKNDPYEPLKKKVDVEVLKKIYYELNKEEKNIILSDLEFRQQKIFYYDRQEKIEKELLVPGLGYTMLVYRFYPEKENGSHILGFLSYANEKAEGHYGLEGFFDHELRGSDGFVNTESGANENVLIINNYEFKKAKNGSNLILTIDKIVQNNICEILNKEAEKFEAESASTVIVNPKTGEIISMCNWPLFDPNNYDEVEDIRVFNNDIVFSAYEPGSVFKALTMAIALDQEKITPETIYYDDGQIMIEGWDKPISNADFETHGRHGGVNMNYVLENSLNTGSIFAMNQVGSKIFSNYVQKFGFGEKTGIELSAEVRGNISNLLTDYIKPVDAAVASFGQGITVTPLQMVMSFAALANKGVLMKPYIVESIIDGENQNMELIKPRKIHRVISERAANLISGMLVNVIDNGHGEKAQVPGYYLGGKTGTAQVAFEKKKGYSDKTIQSFIGYGPIEDPVFVMLVRLDNPARAGYASKSAAEIWGKMANFLLQYYEIPKSRRL